MSPSTNPSTSTGPPQSIPGRWKPTPSFQAAAIRRVLWWYAVSLFLILLLLFVLFLLLWFSCGQSIWGIVRESFALPFLFPLGIASVVVQYGRILHYFREMSQKLALGDALNHRKPWRAQTKRRLAMRWTIVGMVVVFGVGIFPSGTVSLPPPPAPDYPFATVSDLLLTGYAYQREPENFSFQRRPNPFFPPGSALDGGRNPHHPGWAHLPGTVPSPVHPHRLSLRRPVVLSNRLKELIAQGRVHAESLALPGLDQAKLVQDAFGSCLLLRQGTQVWRVSLNHMEDGVWPPPCGRRPCSGPGDHSSCLIFWMAFFSRREICAWEMPMWAETSIWVFPSKKRRRRMVFSRSLRCSMASRRAICPASSRRCSFDPEPDPSRRWCRLRRSKPVHRGTLGLQWRPGQRPHPLALSPACPRSLPRWAPAGARPRRPLWLGALCRRYPAWAGHPHGAVVSQVAADLPHNHGYQIGAGEHIQVHIEIVNAFDEAHASHLEQIVRVFVAAIKLFDDTKHQAEISLDQLFPGFLAPPALACRKSSWPPSRLSTGSLAVLTPLISTLPRRPMVILPRFPCVGFSISGGKALHTAAGKVSFIVPLPSMDFSGFPLGKGGRKGKKSLQFGEAMVKY